MNAMKRKRMKVVPSELVKPFLNIWKNIDINHCSLVSLCSVFFLSNVSTFVWNFYRVLLLWGIRWWRRLLRETPAVSLSGRVGEPRWQNHLTCFIIRVDQPGETPSLLIFNEFRLKICNIYRILKNFMIKIVRFTSLRDLWSLNLVLRPLLAIKKSIDSNYVRVNKVSTPACSNTQI